MAPGIPGIEGSAHGHDVVSVKGGVNYLKMRGYGENVWGLLEVGLSGIDYIQDLTSNAEHQTNPRPNSLRWLYEGTCCVPI